MKKVLIDCYGFRSELDDYGIRITEPGFMTEKKQAAEVATADPYTYIRFTTESPCVIHRITSTDSGVTVRYAYGAWNRRTSLQYTTDLNTPLEIEVSE